MTVGSWLTKAQKKLAEAGIATARLDCLILLEDALDSTRAHLLAHSEISLDPVRLRVLNKKIIRRCSHVPLAYIRGKAAFYRRDFIVNSHVLVPRPETEAIIDVLKTLALPSQCTIADVGAGSGCIGITVALEVPGSKVCLYDIDLDALDIARKNAHILKAEVSYKQQDLFTDDKIAFDVVLANLPYVPAGFPINQAATFEPALALFAGSDGLTLYKKFWQQLKYATKPQYILTESLPSQHHTLATIAREAGYCLEQTSDFVQLFVR